MTGADEKVDKFIIKHVFKDVKNQLNKEEEMIGPVEKHHGVEWKLRLFRNQACIDFRLDCFKTEQSDDWSIDTDFDVFADGKEIGETGECIFCKNCSSNDDQTYIRFSDCDKYLSNDEMSVDFHVTINKMTGSETKNLRDFDQESAEKFSDVVLVVGGEKFYVLKKFLAMHSSYFESMFFGSFAEFKKPEIELKDIDAEHFQNFLELINGDSLVNEYTVEGILKLADFFGAKTAVKRCQEFLLKRADFPPKKKFKLAIEANFDDVKRKCLAKMKSKEDVKDVLPDDPTQFHQSVWAELVEKLCTFD